MKSPEPRRPEKVELDFYEALKEIMSGKSITKLEWGDRRIHALLKDTRLQIHKINGQYYNWVLSDGDIYGDDYVVL